MCTCADDAMHYYMNCVCWRLRSFLVEEWQHRTGRDRTCWVGIEQPDAGVILLVPSIADDDDGLKSMWGGLRRRLFWNAYSMDREELGHDLEGSRGNGCLACY